MSKQATAAAKQQLPAPIVQPTATKSLVCKDYPIGGTWATADKCK